MEPTTARAAVRTETASRPIDPPANFVVVPEGLCAVNGRAEPSWAFKAVLDAVHESARAGDRVLLAPANAFGLDRSEQRVAADYLAAKRPDYEIVVFDLERPHYLNTRHNAGELREFLRERGEWPLENAVLVSFHLHSFRAGLVFRQEGYAFARNLSVARGSAGKQAVVPRLWYFNFPLAHRIYEALTTCASFLRIL